MLCADLVKRSGNDNVCQRRGQTSLMVVYLTVETVILRNMCPVLTNVAKVHGRVSTKVFYLFHTSFSETTSIDDVLFVTFGSI